MSSKDSSTDQASRGCGDGPTVAASHGRSRRRWHRRRAPPNSGKWWPAFQRGRTAFTQWMEREGNRPAPRGHRKQIAVDGEVEPAVVKLDARVSNTRARRDKLTPEQRVAIHPFPAKMSSPFGSDRQCDQVPPNCSAGYLGTDPLCPAQSAYRKCRQVGQVRLGMP
jgi:hypothetical protein